MPTLYLTEQGAKLSKSGNTLIVTKEGEKLMEVECHRICLKPNEAFSCQLRYFQP